MRRMKNIKVQVHPEYKGIIEGVPEGWQAIVAKSPMELTEEDIYKIEQSLLQKLNMHIKDEKEIHKYVEGILAVKKDFPPEVFIKAIITDIAYATGNWNPNKEFFKPKKVIYPYFPSR